ncbi:hypothetical protein HMPREF1613_01932 [Escherichia coli 908616]|nr:hypothetical protein ECSTECC16502_1663 [Escherichia coli STEC_C165-02]ESA93367.1 hypothetical protein HMPREF1599_00931 [Escherichia coli 907713]ESD30233.1 hypothetical protein HMPREF1600_00804 [Escherichia coli 907715]ESD54943.1 hypothetical protein HMPREF1606_02914 [Escherichia coli 908522]ESD91174.1 hypothetical protein HMPREF1613_01932 [Escherichia coli 908616]ESD97144.1 hypothetical protein HMPREF1612_00217 [Escherichia coli 908585]KDY11395.1 hypothetical protein AC72_1842 [Escherichia
MPDAPFIRPTERHPYTPHSISLSQIRSNNKQQTLFFDLTR